MIRYFVSSALLGLLLASNGSAVLAQEAVRLYAAGSLRVALTEVAVVFEKQEGIPVATEFGASGLLRERIEKGAPAEVFASADMGHPQTLRKAGRAGPVALFARNRLCALASPQVNVTTTSLLDVLLDPKVRVGTSTPINDPSGDYTWAMFEKAEKLRRGAYLVLSDAQLSGKVVVIDFWTYSCINCLRAIPYVKAWADKYRSQGLVVIGVHTPEFAFEKNIGNVKKAVSDLQIGYPIAVDNDYLVWRAFKNRYWPARYFIDAAGKIRHHHFGESGYDESERVIQKLLGEAGQATIVRDLVSVNPTGAQAPSVQSDVLSPETYTGYDRAERFVSSGGAVDDKKHSYTTGEPRLNEWGLTGEWTIGKEHATLDAANGTVVYRFHARDLHLVLGAGSDGKPVRFRLTVDGTAPGADHGVDVNAAGEGVVTGQRLYQLVRQKGPVTERTFKIRFLDPGVEVFAFTFG